MVSLRQAFASSDSRISLGVGILATRITWVAAPGLGPTLPPALWSGTLVGATCFGLLRLRGGTRDRRLARRLLTVPAALGTLASPVLAAALAPAVRSQDG